MPTRGLGRVIAVGALGVLALGGCAPSTAQLMAMSKTQTELRSIQSRAFDTTDREATLRAVVATLQDLGFVIDNASLPLGSVSGTKLARTGGIPSQLRMTVTVRPRGATQLMVRANAQHNLNEVSAPEPYQLFFVALSRAMFLDAQQVE
jgi:hypothetical protein